MGIREMGKLAERLNRGSRKDRRVGLCPTRGGIREALQDALDAIGGIGRYVKPGDTVFIKPNLTGDRDPSTGAVTNPEVTRALIEIVQEKNPTAILAGDSPSWGFDAETVYEVTGMKAVASQTGCTLVNLDRDKQVECRVESGRRLRKVRIACSILEADKLINVPVMKTHMQCVVTLGLKNMKGILPRKNKTRLHDLEPWEDYSGLDTGVADLHRLIRPDLTIIDGTIGMEGRGPFDGDPVRMDLLVAGEDAVGVDAVCAAIMGFDPAEIPTIRLCAQDDGVRLGKQQVLGATIESVRRPFLPCPTEVYAGENVQIFTGKVCSGCLATLNTAIHRLMKTGDLDELGGLGIAVGKGVNTVPGCERLVYVGKCATSGERLQRTKERWSIGGCPPTGWRIVEALREMASTAKKGGN
jgi:uncharacterized protein (DUF362 family)